MHVYNSDNSDNAPSFSIIEEDCRARSLVPHSELAKSTLDHDRGGVFLTSRMEKNHLNFGQLLGSNPGRSRRKPRHGLSGTSLAESQFR